MSEKDITEKHNLKPCSMGRRCNTKEPEEIKELLKEIEEGKK